MHGANLARSAYSTNVALRRTITRAITRKGCKPQPKAISSKEPSTNGGSNEREVADAPADRCFCALPRNVSGRVAVQRASDERPEILVKAIIYPQVLADAIRLPAANVIPVAILSSETFDSTTIDPASLTLVAPALNLMGSSNAARCKERDVNGDGLVDLLCQFELAHLPIKSGFSMAMLQGRTTDGIAVRAEVPVHIVPDHSLLGPSSASGNPEMPR